MAPHDSYQINSALPPRRWSRPYAITLSDTNTDRNMQRNRKSFRFVYNVGTGGKVMVTYEPDNDTATAEPLWINQGAFVEGGLWVHARSTGATAGVELYGCDGMEHVGS